MKVRALFELLDPYSAMLAAYGNERLANQIVSLKEAWTPAMTWNVKDLISRSWPREPLPDVDEVAVQEFRDALSRLQGIVAPLAKQDVIKDLSALVHALEPHDRQDLAAFVDACKQALKVASSAPKKTASTRSTKRLVPINERFVEEMIQQLRDTYKDPVLFIPLHDKLRTDKSISPGDMAAIASQFAYETPASTKRAESLRRIMHVHESYANAAARSDLTDGKSAA